MEAWASGKTHLLQAIGHYVLRNHPGLKVRYVTLETFTNEFINSLRDDSIEGFKNRYRTVDVLLIDDVQFLQKKEQTQEEFFHTFNTLYDAQKQIVLTSDRHPKGLATLEDRLVSRFEWGLITDIQPPDLETRVAILRKKARTDRLVLADDDTLMLIASRVPDEHPGTRRMPHPGGGLLLHHQAPHRRGTWRARCSRISPRPPPRASPSTSFCRRSPSLPGCR